MNRLVLLLIILISVVFTSGCIDQSIEPEVEETTTTIEETIITTIEEIEEENLNYIHILHNEDERVLDSSGYNDNWEIIGNPTSTAGKFGNAVNFTDGFVKTDQEGYLAVDSLLEYTIEAWIKQDFSHYNDGTLSKVWFSRTTETLAAIEEDDGNLNFFQWDKGTYGKYSFTDFSPNVWYYIAMRVNSTHTDVFINGEWMNTFGMSVNSIQNNCVGYGSDCEEGQQHHLWGGLIDEIRFSSFWRNDEYIENQWEEGALI